MPSWVASARTMPRRRVGEVVVAEVEVLEREAAVVPRPEQRAREALGLLALPAELDVVERQFLLLERGHEPLLVVWPTIDEVGAVGELDARVLHPRRHHRVEVVGRVRRVALLGVPRLDQRPPRGARRRRRGAEAADRLLRRPRRREQAVRILDVRRDGALEDAPPRPQYGWSFSAPGGILLLRSTVHTRGWTYLRREAAVRRGGRRVLRRATRAPRIDLRESGLEPNLVVALLLLGVLVGARVARLAPVLRQRPEVPEDAPT